MLTTEQEKRFNKIKNNKIKLPKRDFDKNKNVAEVGDVWVIKNTLNYHIIGIILNVENDNLTMIPMYEEKTKFVKYCHGENNLIELDDENIGYKTWIPKNKIFKIKKDKLNYHYINIQNETLEIIKNNFQKYETDNGHNVLVNVL